MIHPRASGRRSAPCGCHRPWGEAEEGEGEERERGEGGQRWLEGGGRGASEVKPLTSTASSSSRDRSIMASGTCDLEVMVAPRSKRPFLATACTYQR